MQGRPSTCTSGAAAPLPRFEEDADEEKATAAAAAADALVVLRLAARLVPARAISFEVEVGIDCVLLRRCDEEN